MLKLYDYYRSTASFRVRIALNLKNLAYEILPINLLKNEQHALLYKSVNPQSLVPTLVYEDQFITQSLAIIEFLNDLYPDPPLFPTPPLQKAEVRAFALAIIADLHPLNNIGVLQFLKQVGVTEDQKDIWYAHWIAKGLSALEDKLSRKGPHLTDYCFGDAPSIADICLVPQLYNARRFSCDISHYPTLIKIDAHCQQHPAFIKAWPQG